MTNKKSRRCHLDDFGRDWPIGRVGEGEGMTSVAEEIEISRSIAKGTWRSFQTIRTTIPAFSSGHSLAPKTTDDLYTVLLANRKAAGRREIARYMEYSTERRLSRFTVAKRSTKAVYYDDNCYGVYH